ncbi:MAG TPA: c-type cytochrome [Anaerolineales bacterium]|nr:c-type cytochrome [Anaerolineales bacterium]
MNEEQKQHYLTRYKKAKEQGEKFFPDAIYKDLLVSFAIFVLLIGLATFLGVANEPPADPSDSAYIPRPEWYFLFLFELLKYFPGQIEWVGTVILPGIAVLALLLLPFYDRSPFRHWKKRKFAVSFMSLVVIGMVSLTIMAVVTTPPVEEVALATSLSEQIVLGQDVYSVQCVECHGADGEGGEIVGVEGLEGVVLKPINSQDEMYTRSDETLYAVIDYGQPDLGMPPFGLGYGGELSRGDILALVNFMRYTWDDRAELPEEAAQAGAIPLPGPDEVPSYEVHIQPILKRFCISCHRPGKKNNNHLMGTYAELMTSGDNAPNITPGSLENNTIQMLYRNEIEAGGPMPPTRPLKDEYIQVIERWILAGAPETAAEAAALSATATPAIPGGTIAPSPSP